MLSYEGDKIRLPLGKQVKAWFGLDSLHVPVPSNLDWAKIQEVKILSRNQAFYVEYIYQTEVQVAAARIVINHCLKYGIDTIVFGWNEGIKQNCKFGKSTQDFAQIPLAKLKTRISESCE